MSDTCADGAAAEETLDSAGDILLNRVGIAVHTFKNGHRASQSVGVSLFS